MARITLDSAKDRGDQIVPKLTERHHAAEPDHMEITFEAQHHHAHHDGRSGSGGTDCVWIYHP